MTESEIREIGRRTLNKGLTWGKITQCTDTELIAFARACAAKMVAERNDCLRVIAYPRRGTDEEAMDIHAAAKMIQDRFSVDDLSSDD